MPTILTTDVLVLGSGLSGLRAAWAAKEHAPQLHVTVTTLCTGPSGSSFTNRNNALGIQFLDTEQKRHAFAEEVTALGHPGFIDQALIEILAEESAPRVREMQQLGLHFNRDTGDTLTLYPGCGSRDPRAIIFTDLNHAFNQYFNKTDSYGVEFLNSIHIHGLLFSPQNAFGAWGVNPTTNERLLIRARTVIMALGGPASLFPHNISGAANPGRSHAILGEAGVALANTRYIQFMWGLRDMTFQNPAALLSPDHTILTENSSVVHPRDIFGHELEELRAARSIHCPAFYHRPQSRLDQFLYDNRHQDGFSHIHTGTTTQKVTLYAHAGNGGAIINENAETSLGNLYAVGECATGMHGANRLGGAMVLATQVFGRRAGIAAAERAIQLGDISGHWNEETETLWEKHPLSSHPPTPSLNFI